MDAEQADKHIDDVNSNVGGATKDGFYQVEVEGAHKAPVNSTNKNQNGGQKVQCFAVFHDNSPCVSGG